MFVYFLIPLLTYLTYLTFVAAGFRMSSSSSTAVNPPTPHLSSLTSSTPSSSDFVFVGQPTSNTMTNAQIVPVSLDQVQMSLSSLGQGLSLEEALMRVGDLMKENADLKGRDRFLQEIFFSVPYCGFQHRWL